MEQLAIIWQTARAFAAALTIVLLWFGAQVVHNHGRCAAACERAGHEWTPSASADTCTCKIAVLVERHETREVTP